MTFIVAILAQVRVCVITQQKKNKMSSSAMDIFLPRLYKGIREMEESHAEKMDKIYQHHANIFEKVQVLYEKRGIQFLMCMTRHCDTLFLSPEEDRELIMYHELRRTSLELETEFEQMNKVHKHQMFPLKRMQETICDTCVDAIMSNPLTYAAMNIKAIHKTH